MFVRFSSEPASKTSRREKARDSQFGKGGAVNQSAPKCPKCDGKMQEGFIVDSAANGFLVSSWHPEKPQDSFWYATKVDRKKLRAIETFRCEKCGYLESYAK
jgi:hypothetical protein